MTLRGEILHHLGKDEIRLVLDHPSIGNILKLTKALSFILFIIVYWGLFHLLSLAMTGFKIALPSTRRLIEMYFTAGFWTFCIYFLELNGVKINVVGDKIENENALIISNHRSLVDHVIFPFLTRRTLGKFGENLIDSDSDTETKKEPKKEPKKEVKKGSKIKFKLLTNEEDIFAKDLSSMMIPRVMFFTWYELWAVPTVEYFKHISQADENWELDGETLVSIFHTFLDTPQPNSTQWIATFPEVNIFSEKDLKMQNILGEKHYLPAFENVLYPRFGNFANAIGGLYKTRYTRLYDSTIIYYNRNKITGEIVDFKSPSLLSILGVRDSNIETVILVHITGKFLSHIPLKRSKLEKYLENRWIKKDKLIAKLEKRILNENSKLLLQQEHVK